MLKADENFSRSSARGNYWILYGNLGEEQLFWAINPSMYLKSWPCLQSKPDLESRCGCVRIFILALSPSLSSPLFLSHGLSPSLQKKLYCIQIIQCHSTHGGFPTPCHGLFGRNYFLPAILPQILAMGTSSLSGYAIWYQYSYGVLRKGFG